MMMILIVVGHDAVKDEKFCSLTLYVFCFVMLIIIYVLLAGSLIYYIWSFIQVMVGTSIEKIVNHGEGHTIRGHSQMTLQH